MRGEHEPYWFPAKRHGLGWGIPRTWQGWAVLAGFSVFLALGGWLLPPHAHRAAFLGYSLGLTAVLLLACVVKGKPLRWR